MRWLLVLLACCFCCLSYAGTTSCNDRCKGYYAKNANFYHNSDGSYNLICEDCDSNVHYGPEIGLRESFFCSYSGNSCSCCGAAYCVWHSCYGVADGGDTYKDRSLCQAWNNTGSCSDCGQNFCSVHNNHKKECARCGMYGRYRLFRTFLPEGFCRYDVEEKVVLTAFFMLWRLAWP